MNEVKNNKKKWELLYEEIKKWEREEIHFHNEIESIIDEIKGTAKYYSVVNQANKKLTEEGLMIESIHGQGYRIINPDKYTDKSLGLYKQGFNRIKKGKKVLEVAPVNEMSKEGLQDYRRVNDRALALHAMMAGGVVELNTLKKKKSKLIMSEN